MKIWWRREEREKRDEVWRVEKKGKSFYLFPSKHQVGC